ncbi:WYL domain-containing protein [Paenibacillaceae bacterium]|nr:WYL domain-containing protein [Paenibacillaceae bacterium]
MAKWDNMLKILWLLHDRNNTTAEQLSAELEISVRTVYRYIDALCASGVPITAEAGHDGGFALPKEFKQAPLFFDSGELKALMQASFFANGAGYPHEEELSQALHKIKVYHHHEQRSGAFERQLDGMEVIPAAMNQAARPMLQLLEKSIVDETAVRIQYKKSDAEQVQWRVIDPYGLAYRLNRWYLAAYCYTRDMIRTFRVDRIEGLELTGQVFKRPEHFTIKSYFAQQQTAVETEDSSVVRIKGTETSLRELAQHWYLRNCVVNHQAGLLTLQINNGIMLEYLPALILSYKNSVHILEPSILRNEMVHIIAELSKSYGDVGDEERLETLKED